MKAIKTLLAATVAIAGLAATADAEARGWSGHRGGHWGGWYGPRLGLYIGAPLLVGSYYWGRPWYDYDYYGPRVVYREVIREPEYVEVDREPAPGVLRAPEGAPTEGPAYMNYCASAKAYYPKVTSCPEGWKFIAPTR